MHVIIGRRGEILDKIVGNIFQRDEHAFSRNPLHVRQKGADVFNA